MGGKRKSNDTGDKEHLIEKRTKDSLGNSNIKTGFELLAQNLVENDKSKVEQIDSDKAPYVVLVGNVGSGKSTVVEKLTGVTGRSSSSAASATRTTEYKWTPDKSLLIADTPGANPRKDKLEHNNEIAAALSYREVSKFLIVAKAHVRMDQTISDIQEYSERFVELPDDLVGVIVTHMDIEKEWNAREIREILDEDFELPDVVFSDRGKEGFGLCQDILNISKTSYKIDVGSSLFSQLFRIQDSNRKILKVTNDFVKRFKSYKESFNKSKTNFDVNDQLDLHCEFWALFKSHLIKDAKQEMISVLDFDFKGKNSDLQQGYVVNMVNQVQAVMDDICTYIEHHNIQGDSERCFPHCRKTWRDLETFWVMPNFTFKLSNGLIEIEKQATKSEDPSPPKITESTSTFTTGKLSNYREIEQGGYSENNNSCGKNLSGREIEPATNIQTSSEKQAPKSEDLSPPPKVLLTTENFSNDRELSEEENEDFDCSSSLWGMLFSIGRSIRRLLNELGCLFSPRNHQDCQDLIQDQRTLDQQNDYCQPSVNKFEI